MPVNARVLLRICAIVINTSVMLAPLDVLAQERPTYDQLWEQISGNSGCTPTEQPDFTMFACKADRALWYFTKPNNPAHPGVIKRVVVSDGKGVVIQTNGWSFASEADQPKFKEWLDHFKALDERARQEMQRRAQQR